MSRDSVHDKIDELLGLLSINNSRLSLHSEGLSMLDIDVLRKQCIELYEQINKLALLPKSTTKLKAEPIVDEAKPEVETAKTIAQEPVAPQLEPIQENEVVPPVVIETPKEVKVEEPIRVEPPKIEIEPELTTEPKPEPKAVPKNKDKAKSHSREDDEMQSLFQKFSSKPIESIAKAISIAKRFEFQSNFFDGEAKEYNTFMSLLDGAHDREEAFAIYHAYKSKFQWDNEDLKDELKALMYRKFN